MNVNVYEIMQKAPPPKKKHIKFYALKGGIFPFVVASNVWMFTASIGQLKGTAGGCRLHVCPKHQNHFSTTKVKTFMIKRFKLFATAIFSLMLFSAGAQITFDPSVGRV
jgi:hypothetical protein